MTLRLVFWLVSFVLLLPAHISSVHADAAQTLLEVRVKGVVMDPRGQTPVVILEDTEEHRAFPIWIGLAEAQAIVRALEAIPTPRPMTHELMHNILTGLKATVTKIVVNDLRDNTFYATIHLSQQGRAHRIDARPSDAIALALGAQAPIFTTQAVLGAVRTVTLPASQAPQPTTVFGMHLQDLDAALANAFDLPTTDGVLVAFVDADSQAERAGMQRGDVITSLDDRPIRSLQELRRRLQEYPGGQTMVLHIRRERQVHTVRLTPRPPQ